MATHEKENIVDPGRSSGSRQAKEVKYPAGQTPTGARKTPQKATAGPGRRRRSSGKNSEHSEQKKLITWRRSMEVKHPVFGLLFAIPNGGQRDVRVAAKIKAEGGRAGVPDLFLAHAAQGYHGLFIEMKVGKNKTTKAQDAWIKALRGEGYRVEVCYGAYEAQDLLIEYTGIEL